MPIGVLKFQCILISSLCSILDGFTYLIIKVFNLLFWFIMFWCYVYQYYIYFLSLFGEMVYEMMYTCNIGSVFIINCCFCTLLCSAVFNKFIILTCKTHIDSGFSWLLSFFYRTCQCGFVLVQWTFTDLYYKMVLSSWNILFFWIRFPCSLVGHLIWSNPI